jgi:hypothetical protein
VAGKAFASSLLVLMLLVAPLGEKGIEALGQVVNMEIAGGYYVYEYGDLSSVIVWAVGENMGDWYEVTGIMRWGRLVGYQADRMEAPPDTNKREPRL